MNPESREDVSGPNDEPPIDVQKNVHAPIVVGIGGSAGGLTALMTLLEALGNAPMALVIVLHLSPDHESHAVEILQRVTPLKVSQVTTRTALKAGHAYVIAPGMNLITDDGHVQPAHVGAQRPSSVIDLFFRTLAEVHRDRAVGIVLSGTGRDGALGLAHVKEHGGLTIVQAPDDCEYPEMSQAALDSGHVDLSLSVAEIGRRLTELAVAVDMASSDTHRSTPAPDPEDGADEDAERAFHDLLGALRARTRHDFRHYKRATLMRRLERRMQIHRLTTVPEYRDFVRRNPDELVPLLADFLISVTNFFRDARAFERLQRDVLTPMLEGIAPGEEARIWVPACASGEEAYSVAILLQECADRMAHPPRMQVFASDINDTALNGARAGVYPANISVDVSDSRLMNFFEKEEGARYRVRTALRETIVFARHNVLVDPPFSRLDLICCRNLLIYLDRTAQASALDLFAYALKPGGYLFLGNAESVDASSDAFLAIDKEHRIYRLRPEATANMRTRLPSPLISLSGAEPPSASPIQRTFPAHADQPLALMHERALVVASPPSVLVNADADIERVSPGAGRFVAFGEGIPTRNLLSNVPPDIRVELRAALFRAGESRRPVQAIFRRSEEHDPAVSSTLALTVHPVHPNDDGPLHFLVVFAEALEDPTRVIEGPADGDPGYVSAMRRLEDENRSLKSHLQETLDRSAVSNEELKASNEELQAINEELRSAKEELETSKEELQSVNEELTTVNFELRMKVDESGRNNDDLRNLMEASDIATVFVDPGMRVKRFTPQASKLFALIPSDIGRPLMDVKSRLNYDEIVDDATAVFKHLRPVERSISSMDDEHFFARILPYRTSTDKIGGAVLTFVNVTELRRAEDRVRLTEERLRDAVASSKDFAVIGTDTEGLITSWNEGAARMFGFAAADILGRPIDQLFTEADRAAGVPARERHDATRDGRASDERWHLRRDGTTFFVSGVMTPLHAGGHSGFLKIARDVSEAKARQTENEAELAMERRVRADAEASAGQKDQFLAVVSHELKQPLNLMQLNAEMLVRLPEAKSAPALLRIGETIMQAVAAQETIVNDLLDLSRIQTGKLQLHRVPTDLAALVQRLGQAYASDAAGKQIALTVDAPSPVVCECDPVRLEQIVWNLLGNAVKFTGEGGQISIRVNAEGDMARLAVSDSGVGIAPSYLPHVFEMFGQGHVAHSGPRRGGLGIGLALVRELVEAHGGQVEAASPGEGLGATFTVTIGLSARAPIGAAASSDRPLSQRILMVDDDAESVSMLAELLRLEGAHVDATTHASEALRMLHQGTYDLVLSDIGMPEMSGFEFMKQARGLSGVKRFRSVAISGYGTDADRREALAAGFDAHLSKPITIGRLRELIAAFGSRGPAIR